MLNYVFLALFIGLLSWIAVTSYKAAREGELAGWFYFGLSLLGILASLIRIPGR